METKKDCPYKKDNSARVLCKAPEVPWEQCAVRKRELGVEKRNTAHSPVKYLQPLWCKETFCLCKLPDSWTHFKDSVWKFEKLKKKKKNGYGNILLNEYNKDSRRRSEEGGDLQEEIERNKAKTDFRLKWEGKKTRKAYITGERPEMPQKTSRVEMDLAENRRQKTHQQRHCRLQPSDDGEKAGEGSQGTNGWETKYRNENSRARRRTSSRNRLSAGEDKSRRNTGNSATQGRES